MTDEAFEQLRSGDRVMIASCLRHHRDSPSFAMTCECSSVGNVYTVIGKGYTLQVAGYPFYLGPGASSHSFKESR